MKSIMTFKNSKKNGAFQKGGHLPHLSRNFMWQKLLDSKCMNYKHLFYGLIRQYDLQIWSNTNKNDLFCPCTLNNPFSFCSFYILLFIQIIISNEKLYVPFSNWYWLNIHIPSCYFIHLWLESCNSLAIKH